MEENIMAKLYDCAVATSKYIDRNGNEKANWENIGAVFEKENGGKFMTLKATFNPAGIERKPGSDNIVISLFPPKEQKNSSILCGQTNKSNNESSFGADLDNMPF